MPHPVGKKPQIKMANLKSDLPSVAEALSRLDCELALARTEKIAVLKVVHGYGSSGVGGDIRIAIQKKLLELVEEGQIQACIFGEDWAKSNEVTWRLVQARPELKEDRDLGRGNRGITVVVFRW